MDIFFALLNALLVGFFNLFRKLALKKSNATVILVFYTSIAFLLSLLWLPFNMAVSLEFVLIFALKGLLLALNWFLILKVLKDADLSIVTITNIISAVLSFVLGIVLFKEHAGIWQIIGSVIIVVGVALVNLLDKKQKGNTKFLHIVLLMICALITTSSTVIDKYTTSHLSSYQVQFWFLLFAAIFSWIFFFIDCIKNKQFLIKKHDFKNFWIYLIGIFLFVADAFLFMAYKVPGSQMITISIIVKLQVVVSVLSGIFVFKEKNILKKVFLSLLVIIGAVMISLF